jgi:hypothetical protein
MGQIGQNLGTVGLDEVLSFDGVRDTVEAIVTQLPGLGRRFGRAKRASSSGCR